MIKPEEFFVIAMPADMAETWCVYEHHLVDPTGAQPGELIYVGSGLLRDVWNMTDARNNSEWAKLIRGGWAIMLRVVATTPDRREAQTAAMARVRSFPTMPRCNLYGRTMYGATRPLICSNGQEYVNQTEAARLLGVSQSAISQHMKPGGPKTIKGLSFSYKDEL